MVMPKWSDDLLGNVATLQRGFDLPYRQRKTGVVPIVTSSGIDDYHAEAKVKAPGVVTGRYGTIGKVFFIETDFWPLNTTLYVRDFQGNNPLFVSYLLKTIDFESHSGKSGVPGVNRNDLHEIVVHLPPTLAEQKTIAEALSDTDALIASLEQLLTKKRQIKKGAMQELLTGKRRLPGFSGEWKEKLLSEISDIRSGGTPSTIHANLWDGDLPWCTPTDISSLNGYKYIYCTERNISQKGLIESSAEIIPINSVIMTSRATIGECAINAIPITTNQGFKNFVPFDLVDAEFLYYMLVTQKQKFISLCGGSTFLEINKGQLTKFVVRLPEEKNEQTAIASVLSDMDAEIAILEGKLAKARQIKQGMMQELLTGRIRLI